MPGARRSRSRSPSSHHRHHHQGDIVLADYGIEKISEDDYFLKSDNFRLWLRQDKDKYFDELSGDQARYYFAKFVKRWNRGQLKLPLYQVDNSASPAPASSQTAYRWSFASKTSKADRKALENVREQIASDTSNSRKTSFGKPASSSMTPHEHATAGIRSPISTNRRKLIGPSMPQGSDAQLLAEEQSESATLHFKMSRKRARQEESERLDDAVLMGGGAAKGERSFRDARGDDSAGFDMRDDVLMGSGSADSFKAA
ncbi:uncharacterized protein EI90DRAFT_3044705 [Cantharellus anzutake]|uniref:uncharacterized protein n=1 Tax=Cantharellus anzutake TaxID=1750568 RepID=UPI0019080457|nr:uncharacterized protein EI90DRAFT_3044705 [Cantharellus anzutake]KAF8337049.1 hypothetical protein EI90DRAFT_3044705 [Cantharellus anzutake]